MIAVLGFRGIPWQTWLVRAAIAVVLLDFVLWAYSGEPGSPRWFLFGAAVVGLAIALAGVLALRARALRAQADELSLARLQVTLSEARQRGRRHAARRLYSARTFYERLREEIQRSTAFGLPLGVIVVRIGQGFPLGGGLQRLVKARVGSLARQRLRSSDVAGQLGPDEFALFLPETDRRGALVLGARLIDQIAELAPGTIGVAAFPEDGLSAHELVDAARRRSVPYADRQAA